MHSLRGYASDWLTGGLHLVVLLVSFELRSTEIWPYSFATMALLSFFGWVAAYKRYRTTADLPTSKIASAAQGYVEIHGKSALIAGTDTRAPFSGKTCCWFRYSVEKKNTGGEWRISEAMTSDKPFLLIDDSGTCQIDPTGAEIMPVDKQVWVEDDIRVSEWRIPENCELFAVGKLSTIGPTAETVPIKGRIKTLHVYQGSRERFIKTEDKQKTKISVPVAATKERKNYLKKPDDGRVFLIAGLHPDKVGQRFFLISLTHVIGIIGFTTSSIVMWC